MKSFRGFASLSIVSVSLGFTYMNLSVVFFVYCEGMKPMMMGTPRENPIVLIAKFLSV
jgi:hypothetical protein